jgi:hypothetical protein
MTHRETILTAGEEAGHEVLSHERLLQNMTGSAGWVEEGRRRSAKNCFISIFALICYVRMFDYELHKLQRISRGRSKEEEGENDEKRSLLSPPA